MRLVANGPVESAARGNVRFAADDWDQSVIAGRVVELHGAEHDAVVG